METDSYESLLKSNLCREPNIAAITIFYTHRSSLPPVITIDSSLNPVTPIDQPLNVALQANLAAAAPAGQPLMFIDLTLSETADLRGSSGLLCSSSRPHHHRSTAAGYRQQWPAQSAVFQT